MAGRIVVPPRHRCALAVSVAIAVISGCTSAYVYREAGIPQTPHEATGALLEFAKDPRPLRRKLVLIHGWRDSPRRWGNLIYWLDRCMTNAKEMVVVVSYAGDQPIGELTQEIARSYQIAGEVDVVGHSMGGLVAREAARRGLIRVNRLFSMASPHEGSYLARYGPWYRQLRDMTPGSGFLNELNADGRSKDFHIVTYWMDGDFLLSQDSAEALGVAHFVLSRSRKPLFRYTHNHLVMDERVIHDIICRLREDTKTPECRTECPPSSGASPERPQVPKEPREGPRPEVDPSGI